MALERLLTVATSLGEDAFILTGMNGREELSRPFAFQLEMVADSTKTVAPADLVGKPIGWTVTYPSTVTRQFHGIVRRLVAGEFLGRDKRVYRAEVSPWFWFLSRTTDCKIFQNLSVPDIITKVFQSFGFSGADYKLNLTGTYSPRDYCVQYRETAFAFVSRLMEEEGIYYYFEYKAGSHTLVLADATSAYYDCQPHKEPEFRPELENADAVSSWQHGFEYPSGKYTHTDYNFETPSTNLLKSTETTVSLANISQYELFDYPGDYPVTARGQALAKVRIEENTAGYEIVTGTSRCSSFMPGGKFTLKGHVTDKDAVTVLAVEHVATDPLTAGVRGGAGSYQNSFSAIPAKVPFRPARLTTRPVVEGPQTAVVVGPSGEEIYTDQYGRVKVQFFWDRLGTKDANSSCWLRVGELWAGKNWGMIFTPRIGQEVIVDFLEGNPDRPIVTGRVYNNDQMPPYALPANMTQSGIKSRSTKGGGTDDFNELRFEDKKDNEQIYFHAQKDFVRVVEHDDTLTVGHDQSITVKNDRTIEVQEGNETITIDKGNRSRTVSKGDDSLTVSTGKRTVEVKSDYSVTVDQGNRKITVSQGNDTHTISQGNREVTVSAGNDTLTVNQGNLKIGVTAGEALIEAGTSITLKVGGNTIVLSTSGIAIQASKLSITVGGSTMNFEEQSIAMQSVQVNVKGTQTQMDATTFAVNADAQAKVSGAMVQVSGSGMTKISGGMVMIN
jgi:type VI secretion system secreted protein VgrG